ncbi:hypothetical protein [Nocardia seriolae]|uniref:Mce-associated membrane protein n=1 Tax=Nocardia seriolae TaxID=37332 RepID=A0A0B8N812_9NOCA|nr:hypothetical protein [Nocardia seriolae]APA94132.1 hypothetical protein NS506_00041 [Nocardia seriolae]MTJ60647.1 hypothetical protein [Nocardia seriolae]MTJ73331.1 hypothetical protein [Nocardia seriolae]MTJ84480.1 hypothetical protein [Nocardia seriolae]MTK28467.1 hypothetical protein [Nocardia seriolae]
MANRKRPVNRVTPRRPAAQRGTASRTTAASTRSTTERLDRTVSADQTVESDRTTRRTTPPRGPSLSKNPAPQQYSKPSGQGGFWRNWGVATVCGALAVLLLAFAVTGAVNHWVGKPNSDSGNLAYVDNTATDEVKAAADHALTTLYGYKAAEIDKWKTSVNSVLTDKMQKDFAKYVDTTVDTIRQTQTDTQVKTDPIGVTLLTGDRAELLVNLNISAVKDNKPEPLASGPIVLRMQKVDGHWLASEITDK